MSKATKAQALNNNGHAIRQFVTEYRLRHEALNNGYQIRVERLVDFYPVNKRYHILDTHERGDWNKPDDLRKIMLKAIPRGDKLVDNMYTSPLELKTDGILKPRPANVRYASSETMPTPDWDGVNTVNIYKLPANAEVEYNRFYVGRNRLHWLYLKFRTRNDKNATVVTKKQITSSVELKVDINKSLPKELHDDDV